MKINKITLLTSALLIALSIQPIHSMQSLKNNPYVKYGAAFVAGAGLMYCLISKPTTKEPKIIIEKESKKEMIYVKARFDFSEQQKRYERITAMFYPIYCSPEDFALLKKSSSCVFINIGTTELKIYSYEQDKEITLYKNLKTFSKKNNYEKKEDAFEMNYFQRLWEPYQNGTITINFDDTITTPFVHFELPKSLPRSMDVLEKLGEHETK